MMEITSTSLTVFWNSFETIQILSSPSSLIFQDELILQSNEAGSAQ